MPRLKSEHLIFLISLVIFLALVPLVLRVWTPLGDEPHYLLMAHSLVFDHDIDLLNNYDRRDYTAFYPFPYLDPHVRITNSGAVILNHDLGLPFVLAPAYALGGRAGVAVFGALVGALLAAQIFLSVRELTANVRLATFTTFALMLTPPLIFYVYLVYPELGAALVVLWSVRSLVNTRAPMSNFKFSALAVALALLPWLSFRYAPLVVLIALYGIFRWRSQRPRAATFSFFIVAGFASYFFVNQVVLAGHAPAGNPNDALGAGLTSVTWLDFARGLIGWWLDQQRGILFLAPIFLIALAGIPRLIKQKRGQGAALILPFVVLSLLIAYLGGFWVAWEMGARYFVVVLPLLAAPLALALESGFARRDLIFYCLTAMTLGLSFAHAFFFMLDPITAYNSSVVGIYATALRENLASDFPALGQPAVADPGNSQTGAQIIANGDDAEWQSARGQSVLIASRVLSDLTLGNYDLEIAGHADRPSDAHAIVLSLDIFSVEGNLIAHADLNANELNAPKKINFDNPYSDYWNAPLSLQATATGEADLQVKDFYFEPDTPHLWTLLALWGGACIAVVVWLNRDLIKR